MVEIVIEVLEEKVGRELSFKWREELEVFRVGYSMSQGKDGGYVENRNRLNSRYRWFRWSNCGFINLKIN